MSARWRPASARGGRWSLALVVVLTTASLVPFLWAVLGAFKTDQEIFGSALLLPAHWRWDNFRLAWTVGRFGAYAFNSIFIAVIAMAVQVAISCPAGYVFAKSRLGEHKWIFYGYLFGLTLPAQAIFIPLFYQLKNYALLDTRWGLIVVVVATGVPFSVYLMRNFYRDLPDSIIEAARIDGAGDVKVFLRVALPLSIPGVMALAVFSFLGAWNEFLFASVILIDQSSRTIPLGLVRFQTDLSANYGALFAGISLAVVPSVCVYALLQRSFIQGLSAGAVK